MNRHKYSLAIRFVGIDFDEVIIDQHYIEKHSDLSDWIILELVKNLDEQALVAKMENDQFSYYTAEPVTYNNKPYRVIFVIEKGYSYLGIVNAFRVKENKNGLSK